MTAAARRFAARAAATWRSAFPASEMSAGAFARATAATAAANIASNNYRAARATGHRFYGAAATA